MCGERATVASAAIVFPPPVAGFPVPSSIPFFLSLVSRLGSLSVSLSRLGPSIKDVRTEEGEGVGSKADIVREVARI